jgi:hypothetical protein
MNGGENGVGEREASRAVATRTAATATGFLVVDQQLEGEGRVGLRREPTLAGRLHH